MATKYAATVQDVNSGVIHTEVFALAVTSPTVNGDKLHLQAVGNPDDSLVALQTPDAITVKEESENRKILSLELAYIS